MRSFVIKTALVLAFFQISAAKGAWDPDKAPEKGIVGFWSSGIKQAFGTAYEAYDSDSRFGELSSTAPISRVWFTAAQGILTEVYWPSVDVAQVRDNQFLVTDGRSFFFEERQNAKTDVQWIEPGVPAFRITNRDPEGRFEIEKIIFTDPDRDVVLQKITVKRYTDGLKFFLLHNPSVSNSPFGDNAFASVGAAPGAGLYAWQKDHAQALITSIALLKAVAGFEGTANDGWQDIRRHLRLESENSLAEEGNVVLTARLDIPETKGTTQFDIALGFGNTIKHAHEVAWESLNRGTKSLFDRYVAQWRLYQSSLSDLSAAAGDGGRLFRASVAVLKSSEDKTRSGAFVASPTVPWGVHRADSNASYFFEGPREKLVSGYHLVWPRDLYQMATSFLAIDDKNSAIASLNYLKSIQFGKKDGDWNYGSHRRNKDGSFPQNCWVDGKSYWGGLQLDEVSMPVILALRLWRASQIRLYDYWDMVRRAADFVADYGPWSPQERWEENSGVSPSNLAAEITALRAAAAMATAVGDTSRAARYLNISESWSHQIEKWVFTTNGIHGDGKYYIRVVGASDWEAPWIPNLEAKFNLANGGGLWKERDVIDGGFLELVRFGIRKASQYEIETTLIKYDNTVRVDFPGIGMSFRRYLGDRYNYDEQDNKQTMGMPWPILTGERGHYEMARGKEKGFSPFDMDRVVNPFIQAMEKFATPSLFIPEQVWDYGPRVGRSTGAATPLGWAHAEYVKLLRSKLDRRVWDQVYLPQ